MRVAHLTTVDLSLRFLLFPQLRAIADSGDTVIAISAPGPWVEGLERDGIHHVALHASTRGFSVVADLRAAHELWRILRDERPDILHTHNPKPGLYGRVVGRLARVPIVVNTVHGLYATETDARLKRWLVYSLEAIAARFSDMELVQNPEDLDVMRRLRIGRRGRVRLLGNGVDLCRFSRNRFSEHQRRELREELGVRPDEVLVGTVGRLVAEKGYPELFQAVSSLGDRYRLVVVGADDPEKPDSLSPDLLRAERARGTLFLGHRDDVDALYAAMDIFVLASHREGFPRAAMEAAAMGLPVVATDVRGCRQVVDDGQNGMLVPVVNPEAMAAAIRRLGESSEERGRMGAAGRRLAQERFDERRCVEIVLETYRTLTLRKGLVSR